MKLSKIKIMGLVLCACFVVLPLIACGGSGKSHSDGAENSGPGATAEQAGKENPQDTAAFSRLDVSDDLPETDYGGYDFNILYITHLYYTNGLYYSEDEQGDVLNGAVYNRQRNVEERFGIKINWVPEDLDIYRQVSKAVSAGDDIYDFVLTHCIASVPAMAAGGPVLDLNAIDRFNFEKPWWNRTMNSTLSIGGVLPYGVSDFIVPEPNAIFFNKAMQQEYGIENLYELVKSGKWTLDKFVETAKITSKDLNGDGIFDKDDQYGLIMEQDWMMISFMYAADQKIFEQLPGEPYPTPAWNLEKMSAVVEKVYHLLFEGNQTFKFPTGFAETDWPLKFDSGRSLFVIHPLSSSQRLRATDVDFGILPFPKYDGQQKDYVNNSWNGLMCIPNVASEPDRTAVIIEALSAESYKYCIPAYYDILLSTKIARDDESLEMLDIIFNNCVYDVGLNFMADWDFLYCIHLLMQQQSKDFMSFYEKNAERTLRSYTKTFEAIVDKYGK